VTTGESVCVAWLLSGLQPQMLAAAMRPASRMPMGRSRRGDVLSSGTLILADESLITLLI
jgi:hypothetical protein